MTLHRICQLAWGTGTLLIILSWIRLVDSQIGWIGFWISLAGWVVSRVRMGGDAERLRLQEAIAWHDKAIQSGDGILSEHLQARGIAKHDIGRFEDAIIDLTAALEQNVDHPAVALGFRGCAHQQLGRDQEAIEDFTRTLEIADLEYDDSGTIYTRRASSYLQLDEYRRSIADYDEALRIDGESADLFSSRGLARLSSGDYAGAQEDCESALELAPNHPFANSQLALILATCPLSELRNGPRSIELAVRTCKQSNWRDWRSIGILAAAYAETGEFEQAVRYARKAAKLAPAEEQSRRQERIEQFSRHEPYRFDPEQEEQFRRERFGFDSDGDS